MVDMNDSVLWAHGSICYEQVRVMDDMNYSKSWGQGSRFYEQPYTMIEMNDYGLSAWGFKCYE